MTELRDSFMGAPLRFVSDWLSPSWMAGFEMILRRNGELDRSRMCPCSQDTKQPRAAFSLRGNTVNRHLKAAMTLTFILSKQELELSLHYHLICCGKSIIRVVFMYVVFTCLYWSPKNRTEKKFPHVSKKLFPLLSFLLLLLFYFCLSSCLSLPNRIPAPPASLLFHRLSPFPGPPPILSSSLCVCSTEGLSPDPGSQPLGLSSFQL